MPLITFEGTDGSGKGTQLRLLRKRLRELDIKSTLYREPGGTPLSEQVRSLLLNSSLHIEPFAELLLFSAARAQLSTQRIRPLLNQGKIVIVDRFYDSTVAYQGGGRGIGDLEWLAEFNRRVTTGLVPDRTYYLRVSIDVARRRRRHRDDDRLEKGGEEFFRRVEATYEHIAAEHPDRVVVIDGSAPVEDVSAEIWGDVTSIIGLEEPGQ